MISSGDGLRQGERRYVTVLFADMKGFTDLSRRLDPEEMDLLMGRVFGRFEAIIAAYGGSVEKYIGDALVAVFGVPKIHEDDPSRAVYAALDFLDQLNSLRGETHLRGVGFRIGINTGLITTGKRGQQEVVTGHAMAVAARLESEADLNSVFVSEATREQCGDDFLFSRRLLLTLSDAGETVAAYRVLRRIHAPPVSDLPFFGRDDLLQALTRRYLRRGGGETIGATLIGEAGIGKTRIATAFLESLRRFPEFDSPVLYARARRFRRRTFAVIRDLILSGLDMENGAEDAGEAEALSRLPGITPEQGRSFAGLIRGEAEGEESETFLLFYSILEELCAGGSGNYPPILLVDNLHHIDRPSEDFLAFFFQNTRHRPFLLATSRSRKVMELPVVRETEEVEVPPLRRAEARELLKAQLTSMNGSLEDERIEEILNVAQGNPLFIIEYGRYAEIGGAELPTTIQSIFLTIVDSYGEEEKGFLKKMSVFAHSFTPEEGRFLLHRSGGDPDRFEELASFFLSEGVFYQESGAFFFRNDAFKMAVYSSLLNHNKRILHRAIADLMLQENAREYLRLMHHLNRAGAYEELERMILETKGTVVHLEAVRYIDALLHQLTADPSRVETTRIADLLFLKAAIYFNNGRTEEADRELKAILSAAVQERNYAYAARAYHILTAYNMKLCSFENAELCGRKALAYYDRSGRKGSARLDVLRNMAVSEMLRNREEHARELVALIRERVGPEAPVYRAALGEILLLEGSYGEALEALNLPGLGEDEELRRNALFLRIRAHAERCDYSSLLSESAAYLELESGGAVELSQLYAYRAIALASEQELSEASLRQAEFQSFRVSNDLDRLDAIRTVVEAHLILGNLEHAERQSREGITIGLRHSSYYPTFSLLVMAAEISLRGGRKEEALFFIEEASFYVTVRPRLRQRDVAAYWFLRWSLELEGDSALLTAREILAEEARAIVAAGEASGNPLLRAFMGQRSFARIEGATAANRGSL
ncbi:MAG: adenylate/guanylate cyclase domain-containing protein [Alkalispirochaetaceae bacterium]